jgi:cysteine-rich repeat protein
VLAGEQCDDGNSVSGDGCSSSCQVERHFMCIEEPSYCMPDIYVDAYFVSV